jgi:hypothetical protein
VHESRNVTILPDNVINEDGFFFSVAIALLDEQQHRLQQHQHYQEEQTFPPKSPFPHYITNSNLSTKYLTTTITTTFHPNLVLLRRTSYSPFLPSKHKWPFPPPNFSSP